MNCSLRLWSKSLKKLFVSKNCFRNICFDVRQQNIVKNHLNFTTKYFENQLKCQTWDQFYGSSYAMFRHYSSQIKSPEKQNKDSDNKPNASDTDIPSDEESKQDLKASIKSKFKKYSDEDSEVIYDVSEELLSPNQNKSHFVGKEWKESDEELYLYQQKPKHKTKLDLQLKRGTTGVFDIHELVDLLREENIKEIAVIEVPKELEYCDYLVLGNATSKRHLNAFSEYFNKVYKMKRSADDPFLNFGGNDSPDWKVVDMKNIVLHLFLKPTREYYDIETLWTVGFEYDDKLQRQERDTVLDIMEKHMKFLDEIKPKN